MIFIYIVVYILVIFFFIIEKLLRKGNDAKTLEKSKYDKRSTEYLFYLFITFILILTITPILNNYNIGFAKFNLSFNIFGLIIMLLGITIRIISAMILGRFYTRTLRKTDNHEIISKGLYKYIRHPGYLGTILLYIGASISMGNIISLLIIVVFVLIVYIYRINVEEEMLIDTFGDNYKAYIKRTKRLLPFIY